VPVGVRERLAAQLAPYRARHRGVRWTRPESWHLTLLFLGSVHPDRVPELEEFIDQVAARQGPYRVSVEIGGGRLRGREGVAWLGLGRGAGALIASADAVAAGCPSGVTDGPAPKRTPSAHLTVVRKADQAVIDALRAQSHGDIGVSWTVDRISLVRSHLDPGGARYETLRESTL